MRKFGFSAALVSIVSAMGGIAGFNPSDPYRFVPVAGGRNISKDNLKASRNSRRYPEPNKIGGRQQTRNARQMAAGKLSFFDHDTNRKMILKRAINHPSVEIAEKIERSELVPLTVDKNEFGVPLAMLQSDRHKRDSKNAGFIEYDKSARAWKLTDLGKRHVG